MLALQRLGNRQAQLNMASMSADSANRQLQHQIDIKVITDGENHVLDRLDSHYRGLFQMVITKPSSPKHLGFEAQRFLASRLDQNYDFYGYFEDDLIIHDPWFFRKIDWFRTNAGDDCLLLPHRVEFARHPSEVDRFFIDGPMAESDLRFVIPEPGPSFAAPYPGGTVYFESPKNPHSGCFVLSQVQLKAWTTSSHWLDGDASFVSPLESAATLGIAKTFRLYKPVMAMGSWLELQHWGRSFHSLLGNVVSFPSQDDEQDTSEDIMSSQLQN
ncbi:hypothetical protein [Synechococcus sp. MU1642]|uniref:hypothetical protein n=1 Tax=Synechococcus sp. MU1642 TaxID=2508348 RepID=UPI001CF9087C|nr:hypothetical protein [Synechococcus sp. MU1642]MCB4406929.1 calcium-binding protein [Synechococcus sp. MU1642]